MIGSYILVQNFARIPQILGLNTLLRRGLSQQSWSEKTWDIISGYKKNIFLVQNKENWDKVLPHICRDLSAVNAIGFDSEWVVKNDKRNPVALLQLATYTGNCVVLRLNRLQHIPSSLKDILEDKNILKVGVGCIHDDRYISMDYNTNVRAWLDLRHLLLEDKVFDIKFGLDSLAKHYLGKNLNKNWKLKASNWESNTLAHMQVAYAAEDAIVGLHILLAQLTRLWKPVLQEESWEALTCSAIEEICKPFVEIDFHYRKNAEENIKYEDGVSTSNGGTLKLPQLQAPDGEFSSHCKKSKAYWYVDNGLGDLVSSNPLIVKLRFEPSVRNSTDGNNIQTYLLNRPSNCDVCGKQDCHIWKNVIPFEYRKYFPQILESHRFDVVVLCHGCLKLSSIKDNELRQVLTEECNKANDGNERLESVRSAGEQLKNCRNQLSPEQIQVLEKIVKEYFQIDTLTEDLITQAANLETQNLNLECSSLNYRIFKFYEKIGLVKLETRCRQWFLDTMKPKYMHPLWSVSHDIEWLKKKMSQYPLDKEIRKDFKVALVGTEGEINIPFQPKRQMRETTLIGSDLKTSEENSSKVLN